MGRRKVEMGQTRSLQRCPLHDRSSTESGSPSAILLCRTSANSGCEHSQQDSPLFDHLVTFWQATKHEHNASPVGNAQANAPEVFSVEPEDFPAAKHMCESSVDRKSKCPISSRQHYCKGLERKVVREQHKVPQTFSPR